ncbi:MAG: hypothetical protein HC848_08070 [Limnobacter sp.]|nr:hypothetical protein [Limnobacter sp.]
MDRKITNHKNDELISESFQKKIRIENGKPFVVEQTKYLKNPQRQHTLTIQVFENPHGQGLRSGSFCLGIESDEVQHKEVFHPISDNTNEDPLVFKHTTHLYGTGRRLTEKEKVIVENEKGEELLQIDYQEIPKEKKGKIVTFTFGNGSKITFTLRANHKEISRYILQNLRTLFLSDLSEKGKKQLKHFKKRPPSMKIKEQRISACTYRKTSHHLQ